MRPWNADLLQRIAPLDQDAMQQAARRQEILTKPVGSLGRLERVAAQVAGIVRNPRPSIHHKAIITIAGDHGVVAEGVSAYPQAVTPQMVRNILAGGAAINVLARHVGARVVVVDAGVATNLPNHPDLLAYKVARGTNNLATGPAMTREQAEAALMAGVRALESVLQQGLDIVGTGDMGIGNTTPSAAICAALTNIDPAVICGRGTGIDDSGLDRKIDAVRRGLAINQPDPGDALDVLSKIGGFEIGGIAGVILGAAAHGIPVVIDGYISTAAAMIAVAMAPGCRPYLIAAHCSQESGHRIMLDWLQTEPLLDLDMRLGEGTGAALAISLVEVACKVLDEMATFEQAGVAGKIEP